MTTMQNLSSSFPVQNITPAFELAAAKSKSPTTSMDKIIGALAAQNDVIIVADTNHYSRAQHKPLHQSAVYNTAKQNGVTDLYLEIPQEFQGDLNDLLNDKISRKEYLDRLDAAYKDEMARLPKGTFNKDDLSTTRAKAGDFADMAIAAKKAGLNVHAVDPQPLSEVIDISVALKNDDQTSLMDGMQNRLKTYDYDVAKEIRSTRQGKAMVVYGALHILPDERYSLDDVLERKGQSVGVVALDDAKPSASMRMAFDMKEKGGRLDIPDYIYNPMTKEFANRDSFLENKAPTLKAVIDNTL